MKKWLAVLICFFHTLECLDYEHMSSAPYISGDTFRAASNWIFDDSGCNFKACDVKKGDTIFVKTDYLESFKQTIHPLIKEKYILITHNSDDPIPGKFSDLLNDPKLIAWFGQNVENYCHPKLHPIPIGLANPFWGHGNIKIVSEWIELLSEERDILLYMNINVLTNYSAREPVVEQFKQAPYCYHAQSISFDNYLFHLSRSKFVLSPRGNGLDCHRTWEALLMGAIPIVISSALDPVFEGLPVLIIHDWSEITELFLLQAYEKMSKQRYHWDRLYVNYWTQLIQSFAN